MGVCERSRSPRRPYAGEARERLDRVDFKPLTARTITVRAALEAELGRVREGGFALVDQEVELGLRSLAAPVRDRDGAAVAALALVLTAPPAASTR